MRPDDASTLSWQDTLPGTMTFVSLAQNSGPAMTCTTGATVSCSASPFPAGATATFTLTAHVPAGTASGTSFQNTATATAPNDPNLNNNSSSTLLIVSSVNLSVAKTGPPSAPAGTDVTYTISLSNAGPDTVGPSLPTVIVSVNCEDSPLALTFAVFVERREAAGDGAAIAGGRRVARCDRSGVLRQRSTSRRGGRWPSRGTNVTYDVTITTTTIAPISDMSITKSGPVAETTGRPTRGDERHANQTSGPSFNCTNTTTTITCTIASFAAGSSATFQFVAFASGSIGPSVTNTVTASSSTPDPAPGNSSASSTATTDLPVAGAPTLSPLALALLGAALAIAGVFVARRG